MWGETDWWKGIQSKNGANALIGLGTGLLQGNTFAKGLAAGGQGFMQGAQLDDQYAAEAERKAKEEQGLNSTMEFLRSKGYDDLLAGVESGGMDMGTAWTEALRRGQPQAPKPPIEVGGVLVDPVTFQPIFDSRQPEKPPAAPAGYQWNQDGTQTFIPGGPADPANMGRTTEAQRRNQQLASVIQPELAAVEQNWSELANPGNQAGGMIPGFGNAVTSPGYQQASNSLATIAQSYLYSVSGAAATDAEVKKIVDSVTPKPFESQQSIDAKLARIRQMADAVIQAGGAGGQQPVAPNTTSTGLQWSIEP